MQKAYYLAVDIGASSGRHMLAHMEDGHILLEEVYRFHNGNDNENGHLVWDIEALLAHVKTGNPCRHESMQGNGKSPAFHGN